MCETIFDVEPGSKHRCDGCGKFVLGKSLLPIQDIEQRVEPGGTVPSGECPDCGALCYPLTPVVGFRPEKKTPAEKGKKA